MKDENEGISALDRPPVERPDITTYNPGHAGCQKARTALRCAPTRRVRAVTSRAKRKHEQLTNFSDLGLALPILEALRAEGYQQPTAIQEKAIPIALAGRDLLGIAQTGTGKTAAFALPIIHRLAANRHEVSPKGCGGRRRSVRPANSRPRSPRASEPTGGIST